MDVTVATHEVPLSREERARIRRGLQLALAAFQPRVTRATVRVRRAARAGAGAGRETLVQVCVPLGPAGLVRVEARALGARAGAAKAIRRAADAVARRLGLERQQLLEFLFLASGAGARSSNAAGVAERNRRETSTRPPPRRAAARPRRGADLA